MTVVLSVDLASKFSAYNVRDEAKILEEGDSTSLSPFDFSEKLHALVVKYNVDWILLEDVPYGINSQFQTKPVLRLQGIIMHELKDHLDKVLFVTPSAWQRSYPGVARGKTRVEAARLAALALGYTPPDLVGDYVRNLPDGSKVLKKHTNPLAKSMTDYIDAFLISDWFLNKTTLDEIMNRKDVQPAYI